MEENMEMSMDRKMEYYRKLIQYYRKYEKVSEGIDWEGLLMMTNKQHIMTEGQLLTAVPFCILFGG